MKKEGVHYIFCENFVEHIPRHAIITFLEESFRVLRPEGILRIATPDIEAYVREYLSRSEQMHLLLERNRQYGYFYSRYPVDILNKAFYEDTHVCLYDAETLEQMLHSVGFREIIRCKVGESPHTALSGIERHDVGSILDEFMLVIEAKKPFP